MLYYYETNTETNTVNDNRVRIPEGFFCGDCSSCVYCNWDDKDKDGWPRCMNSQWGGYVYPPDRAGCWHYKYQS